VDRPFHCCEQQCRRFGPNELVQLGYDGSGKAILFIPQWTNGALAIPDRGTRIDAENIESMTRLRVPVADTPVHESGADDRLLH